MNNPAPVYGNYEDKYNARNPISKFLVRGFLSAFDSFLHSLPARNIASACEVGCAEGELLKHIHSALPDSRLSATDISEEEIEKARKNCSALPVTFSVQNAEALQIYQDASFDLVVCCEVLEHLTDPVRGLNELHRISSKYVLVSVPNEPVWKTLNILRGKYIKSLGNTPGHLNHWNVFQFPHFLGRAGFTLLKKKYPFPWQMVLLEKKLP